MIVLETVAVALAMYSALPVPQPEWNERNMRYALCAFPLAGAAVGLGWWGWSWLCGALTLPDLLRAAGLCALPVVITGGIHLDGFADTSDALAGGTTPERRQEILKDSHCGAFAIIRLCTYFALYLGVCGALKPDQRALLCMGAGSVLIRCLSGLSVASFPLAKNTGLAHAFASAADKGRVRVILLLEAVLACAVMCAAELFRGLAMTLAVLVVFRHYARTARQKFGGLSGDLAGWFLQRAEWWMLAALVLCQRLEALPGGMAL